MLFFTSCKKDEQNLITPDLDPPAKGVVKPVGNPEGELVSKEIGPDGGTLTSADSKLLLQIPAGALESSQIITIGPIFNTNPAGKNNSYRLNLPKLQFGWKVPSCKRLCQAVRIYQQTAAII